jgi:hypothetical protein
MVKRFDVGGQFLVVAGELAAHDPGGNRLDAT